MQILVATLRGAVHQQQRAAAYAALLPSLMDITTLAQFGRICSERHLEMGQAVRGTYSVVHAFDSMQSRGHRSNKASRGL